jgi:HEAT repeat protein
LLNAALLLSFLLALPVFAAKSPQDLLNQMEKIELRSSTRHPLDRSKKDKRLASYGEKFRKQELKAVPLLTWYIAQKKRPLNVRLYAAAFLGLIKERSAFHSLKARALDKSEDAGMRAMALSSLGSLGVPAASLRAILDKTAHPKSPRALRREAYSQLAVIGTGNIKQTLKTAKKNGSSPTEPGKFMTAGFAVEAISRSRDAKAEDALFKLLTFFKKSSPLRSKVLVGLSRQRLLHPEGRKRPPLSLDHLNLLSSVMFDNNAEAALTAARLLGGLADSRATLQLVRRIKSSNDPALLAELAQSIGSIGDPRGAPAVLALADGIIKDKRFSPGPGKTDPRDFALRIQEAAKTFRQTDTAMASNTKEDSAAPPTPKKKRRPALVSPKAEDSLPFRYEGWPGAGTPKLEWNATAPSLILREKPSKQSALVAALKLPAGKELTFNKSMVVTAAPGRAHARQPLQISGRDFGKVVSLPRSRHEGPSPTLILNFQEGDQLEILAYRADGQCFIRKDYRVLLTDCPQDNRKRFSILSEFKAEWWLHVRIKDDEGWFNTDQDGLDFLPRY